MRKRPQRSRKRAALGWLGIFCLLVLACDWLGLYHLTPGGALRDTEQTFFTGKTTVEAGFWGEGGERLLLSQNEQTMLVSLATWSPLRGFEAGFPLLVERTDAAVDAGWGCYSWDTEENYYPYLIGGCVNDPRVVSVEVELRRPLAVEPRLREEAVLLEKQTAKLRPGKDGRTYFLLDLGIREEFPIDFWAIARDAGGAEVSCRKVEDFMSLVEKLLS